MTFQELLHQKGLRVTKANKLIYNLIKDSHSPLSAKDIWQSLDQKINLVSVYRVLDKLVEAKILQTDSLDKDRVEKVYHLKSDHHHHFVCENCEKVFCVPCKLQTNLPKKFTILKHQVQLTGLCNQCN